MADIIISPPAVNTSLSVVIPAYNNERYINRAIESVLRQTHPANEIIVVDDGSTDNTANVVKAFGKKIYYLHQANAGPGAARNNGVRAAKSTWIAFLDSDDEWLDHHLESHLNILCHRPELMWSCGNYYQHLNCENRRAPRLLPQQLKRLLNGKDFFDDYFCALRYDAHGWTGTMIIQRDLLLQAGLFRENISFAEDLDLWLRIATQHPRIGCVIEPTSVYYLHGEDSLVGSLTHQRKLQWFAEVLSDNISRTRAAGRWPAFKPAAVHLLRLHIRSGLFDPQGNPARTLLHAFADILPGWYRLIMGILVRFPRATARGCRVISHIVRRLKLRRQVVRRPPQ